MAAGPATSTAIDPLAARSAIAELLARLCHARDRRRWWMMPELFHPDATACEPGLDGPTWRDFVAQIEGASQAVRSSHHQLGSLYIDQSGHTATAHSYVTIFRVSGGGGAAPRDGPGRRLSGGRYIDRCECRDGVWRIADHLYVPGPDVQIADSPHGAGGVAGQDEADPSGAVVARWQA